MTEQEMIASVIKCPSPFDTPLVWQPTEFEKMLEHLGLTESECVHSAGAKAWCRTHKNKKFIPEWVLQHFGLKVSHDLYGEESSTLQHS